MLEPPVGDLLTLLGNLGQLVELRAESGMRKAASHGVTV